MTNSYTAVIVGVSQLRRRPKIDGPSEPIEPIQMMLNAAQQAARDAGDAELGRSADYVGAVPSMSWAYEYAPTLLSSLMGARPMIHHEPISGGSSPLDLLHHAVAAIGRGEVKVAVLAGAETFHSHQQAAAEGFSLSSWTAAPSPPIDTIMRGQPPITSPLEMRHGLYLPADVFPMFENAQRAHAGRSIENHQTYMGQLMAECSAAAAQNNAAWYPEKRSANEFTSVDKNNRWINFPYPKLMNANIMVDMAAALIVMSTEEANKRGIPKAQQVAFLGGACSADPWTLSGRSQYYSSPACNAAAQAALSHAGLDVSAVDLFDLYSCFPSAIGFGKHALGLSPDQTKGLTVTGGLACYGGPGNNFTTHSVAEMVVQLRSGKGSVGYVSGLSMAASKHTASLFSTDPRRIAEADGKAPQVHPASEKETTPEVVDAASGAGTIETYTVNFNRDNQPEASRMIIRLDDGRRTLACGEASSTAFDALIKHEGVGLRGVLTPGEGDEPNQFILSP